MIGFDAGSFSGFHYDGSTNLAFLLATALPSILSSAIQPLLDPIQAAVIGTYTVN